MANDSNIEDLASLLTRAGQSHHQAFLETDGADAEWPLWYAEYLEERIGEHLGKRLTRSKLVQCLLNADDEYNANGSAGPWPQFFARYLLGLSEIEMDAPHEPDTV